MMLKLLRGLVIAALVALITPAGMARAESGHPPVVLVPAYHLTKLRVTVHDQTAAPGCPRSGGFEYWFQNDHPSTTFPQICQDQLLTMRFDPNPHEQVSRAAVKRPANLRQGLEGRVQVGVL